MKRENKRVITAVDVIILVSLIFFGYLIYRTAFANTHADTYEIDYVVKVSSVRSELSDRIANGDEVYSMEGEYMGRVTAYEARTSVLPSGQTMPGCSDLYITIEAQATGDGVVAGSEIYVEGEYELYTPGLYFKCVCISVKK